MALMAMLPVSLMALAAAGPTLANIESSERVGRIICAYLAADAAMLLLLTRLHRFGWAWAMAAVLAVAPAILLLGA